MFRPTRPTRPTIALLLLAAASPFSAAQVLTSRAQLDAILTDQSEIEDFEFVSLHAGGIYTLVNPMSDETAPSWYGLVPGIEYESIDGELELQSIFSGEENIVLRATNGLRISFATPQIAIGFTMLPYSSTDPVTVHYFRAGMELDTHEFMPGQGGFSGYSSYVTGVDEIVLEHQIPQTLLGIDDLTFGLAYTCPADIDGNGTLDFFDVSAFLTLYADRDDLVDFNLDGSWDFFDISIFLSSYNAGCP